MSHLEAHPPLEEPYPSLGHSECPFPFYGQLRERCPVVQVAATGDYLISRHEDVAYALRATDVFSSDVGDAGPRENEGGYQSMMLTDPPEHMAKRRLAFEPFRPGRLRAYTPMVQECVDELIDAFIDQPEVDLMDALATPLPIMVTSRMLGLPAEDFDQIRDWSTLEGSGQFYMPHAERMEEIAKDKRMVAYLNAMIKQRRENPGEDVISEMIAAQIARDGEYNEVVVTAEGAVLLLGGIVTTAHLISSALLLLLTHPQAMAAVRADPSQISTVLEESLRLESPVQWRPRRCLKDTELGGMTIPAGATVLLLLQSANRDDERFPGAEDFDITRENVKRHVAFGFGAHFCLGAPLARIEGKLALETLLRRTGDITLAMPEEDVRHVPSVLFRAPTQVPVRLTAA